jgi:hypothetical protein
MILFLIKSDAPDPTNGLLNGWRPASERGFEYSMVPVQGSDWFFHDHGRWTRPDSNHWSPRSRWCSREEDTKEWVFKAMNRTLPATPEK